MNYKFYFFYIFFYKKLLIIVQWWRYIIRAYIQALHEELYHNVNNTILIVKIAYQKFQIYQLPFLLLD